MPPIMVAGARSRCTADHIAIEPPRLANVRGRSKPGTRLPLGAPWKPNGMISTSRFSVSACQYVTSAFLFTMPGFETEELAQWSDNGNERRRLRYVATHCLGLVSHNFIAGRDYFAQINAGLAAAHSLSDDEDFAGMRWRPNGGSVPAVPTQCGLRSRGRCHRPCGHRILVNAETAQETDIDWRLA
jgi:hypothetical protein